MKTQLKENQEAIVYAVFLRSRKHNRVIVINDNLSHDVAVKHTMGLRKDGLPVYYCETSVLVEQGILNRK